MTRADLRPITRAMLDDELRRGRVPIYPENAPAWLDPADWRGWPVLSFGGGELIITAIIAARSGALTRLVKAAQLAGFGPVIVCPVGDMKGILDHWGWQCQLVGDGWDLIEHWRPPAIGAAWHGDRRS